MRAERPRFFQPQKRSKLRNRRIELDGYKFASKLEAAVYLKLRLLASAGHIKILKHQVRVSLSEAKIIYIPDFLCLDLKTEAIFYVEAKGFPTSDWKIKKKLWSSYGSAPLQIWKGTYKHPFIEETITPLMPKNY